MNSSARTPARAAFAAVALTCLAALATGCAAASGSAAADGGSTPTAAGGAGSSSAPSPSTDGTVTLPAASPAPTAPGASPTPASGGVAPGGGGSAAAGGTQPCATRDLKVALGEEQGAAGSLYQVLVFTDISAKSCTLYGYPGVSLTAGKPVEQVGLAAARNAGSPVAVITLAPGKSGNALLQIAQADNYPAATCGPVDADYLQIYPPNQTTPTYVADSARACSKPVQILRIGPMLAGNGGTS